MNRQAALIINRCQDSLLGKIFTVSSCHTGIICPVFTEELIAETDIAFVGLLLVGHDDIVAGQLLEIDLILSQNLEGRPDRIIRVDPAGDIPAD